MLRVMPETGGRGARRYTTALPGLSRRRHQSRGEERWLGRPSDSREYKDRGATVNREINLEGQLVAAAARDPPGRSTEQREQRRNPCLRKRGTQVYIDSK